MKLIFKSLINNDACITGGRKRKWWVALLILLFSTIVLCVPTLVSGLTTQGDNIFSQSTYSLDHAFNGFLENCVENDIKLTVSKDSNGENHLTTSKTVDYTFKNNDENVARFIYVANPSNDQLQDLTSEGYTCIIFTEHSFYYSIVNQSKPNSPIVGADSNAYKDFSQGDLVEKFYATDDQGNTNYDKNVSNLRTLFRKTHNYRRVVDAWVGVGILAGISLIVVFLMGLMVFILTRGKRNAYRIFKFWECQKIAYWATISPAILSLIFGFITGGSSLFNIWFVMFFGIRTMWLSMKSLKPDGTGYPLSKDEIKTVDVKPTK